MAYTTINKSTDHFNTVLYTGNETARTITVGMQPDFTWTKARSQAHSHITTDVVTGVGKRLRPNVNNAQDTSGASVASFVSTGFTLTNDATINENSTTYVSWNWKANGAGSSNTDGSINTTYTSANTTSGFSISTYTGTGSNATVGHGLGAVPKVVLVKGIGHTSQWYMYHIGTDANGVMLLDGTAAKTTDTVSWQNTTPTSSVFSIGNDGGTNGSGNTYVAYCFAEKTGFSKFGSYTGNGNADGAFVYTGFKPAFVLIKKATGSTDSWFINDNKRSLSGGTNTNSYYMRPNENAVEGTSASLAIDILSNGVKIRNTDTAYNNDNSTYIYMAFAEAPLVGSNNIPCTAR